MFCGWWKSECVQGVASGYMCSSGLCIGETGCEEVYEYVCSCKLVEEGCACGFGCSIQVY